MKGKFGLLYLIMITNMAIIFGCLCFFSFLNTNINKAYASSYADSATVEWYDENTYEETNTFFINSNTDLAGLASLVNSGVSFFGKVVKLNCNITLNEVEVDVDTGALVFDTTTEWVPIGTSLMPFEGVFDGQNNAIKGLYIDKSAEIENNSYLGLFGAINGATITKINIAKARIIGKEYVGGIAGFATGVAEHEAVLNYATNTIERCYFDGEIGKHAQIGNYIGGIVGQANAVNFNSCFFENSSKIDVDANYVGGIAGLAENSCTFEQCKALGSIGGVLCYGGGIAGSIKDNCLIKYCYADSSFALSGEGSCVGNIAGYIYKNSNIKYSNNSGSLMGEFNFAGGIAGKLNLNCALNFTNNSGDIICSEESTFVGGIAGDNYDLCKIVNCENTGEVYAIGTKVGGVVGRNAGSLIEKCFNSKLENKETSANVTGIDCVGGIAGQNLNNDALILECKNYGDIFIVNSEANGYSNNIGGVVGENSSASISYSYNYGMVNKENEELSQISATNIGGIAGFDIFGDILFCCNEGNVLGVNNTNAGGLVGENNQGTSLYGSFNFGSVYGETNIGGLVGNNNKESIIKFCVSNGDVIGSEFFLNVGSITGLNSKNSKILNCYYNKSECQLTSPIGKNENVAGVSEINTFVDGELNKIADIISRSAINDGYQNPNIYTSSGDDSQHITFNLNNVGALSIGDVLAIILTAGVFFLALTYVFVTYINSKQRAKQNVEFDGYGKDPDLLDDIKFDD